MLGTSEGQLSVCALGIAPDAHVHVQVLQILSGACKSQATWQHQSPHAPMLILHIVVGSALSGHMLNVLRTVQIFPSARGRWIQQTHRRSSHGSLQVLALTVWSQLRSSTSMIAVKASWHTHNQDYPGTNERGKKVRLKQGMEVQTIQG